MKIFEMKAVYTAIENAGRAEPLSTAKNIVAYMAGFFDERPQVESFYCVLLNRRNVGLGRHLVTIGTLTCALAHPREVYRPAIVAGAASLVCVHNHPSGDNRFHNLSTDQLAA
jgi:DNA repair protein RadC